VSKTEAGFSGGVFNQKLLERAPVACCCLHGNLCVVFAIVVFQR